MSLDTLAIGAVAASLVLALAAPSPARAADATDAPITTISADGRSVTDGTRTLRLSNARGLSTLGESVTVTGSGYATNKGIYVAFCVAPAYNQLPTPCGGGSSGDGSTSTWVSSNPPSYGEGVATPYGPGGTFQATFDLDPVLNATTDCRVVVCAVVTRNDHIRTTDRSQDLILPVGFAPPGTPTTPPTTSPPTTAPPPTSPPTTYPGQVTTPTTARSGADNSTTTVRPIDVALPAPRTAVAADGLSASDGVRTLRSAKAASVDPAGEPIVVSGSGFDGTKSVKVALCLVPPVGTAPTLCAASAITAGPAKVAARFAAPADPVVPGAGGASQPLGPGGSFSTTLFVAPEIDARTDCRVVACGLIVRNDLLRPSDRSQDVVLPVSFASGTGMGTNPGTTIDDDASTGSSNATVAAVGGNGGISSVPDGPAPGDENASVAGVAASERTSSRDSGSRLSLVVLAFLVAIAAAGIVVVRRRTTLAADGPAGVPTSESGLPAPGPSSPGPSSPGPRTATGEVPA